MVQPESDCGLWLLLSHNHWGYQAAKTEGIAWQCVVIDDDLSWISRWMIILNGKLRAGTRKTKHPVDNGTHPEKVSNEFSEAAYYNQPLTALLCSWSHLENVWGLRITMKHAWYFCLFSSGLPHDTDSSFVAHAVDVKSTWKCEMSYKEKPGHRLLSWRIQSWKAGELQEKCRFQLSWKPSFTCTPTNARVNSSYS